MSGLLSKEVEEVERVFRDESKELSIPISSELCIDGEWAGLRLRSNC